MQEAKLKDLKEFMANEQAKRESLGYDKLLFQHLYSVFSIVRPVEVDGEQPLTTSRLKVFLTEATCCANRLLVDYSKNVLEGKVKTTGARTNKENLSETTPNPSKEQRILFV